MLFAWAFVKRLTLSHSTLLEKLADHGLKRHVDSWHKKPAEELAQWPGIESLNEMSKIQMVTGHQWHPPWLRDGASFIETFL